MAWTRVAATSDVAVGEMIQVTVEEEEIALYRTDEGWFATSDVCTHASAFLTDGTLQGCIVQCPKHGGKFDVRSGEAKAFPCTIPVASYPVEVRGEDVLLDFE